MRLTPLLLSTAIPPPHSRPRRCRLRLHRSRLHRGHRCLHHLRLHRGVHHRRRASHPKHLLLLPPETFYFTDGVQTFSSASDSIAPILVGADPISGISYLDFSVSAPDGANIESATNLFDNAYDPGLGSPCTTDASAWGGPIDIPSPVPEPSTIALLASGILRLIAPIRRRLF